jgi:hypothetical protein
VLRGLNVPLPLLVHKPWPVPPAMVPDKTAEALLPHTTILLLTKAKPGVVVLITNESLIAPQPPLCVDVKNNVTIPAVESALLNWYVEFNVESFGKNIPLPDVVQIPVVLPPLTVPLKAAVFVDIQTEISVPAFTIGVKLNVNVKESPLT